MKLANIFHIKTNVIQLYAIRTLIFVMMSVLRRSINLVNECSIVVFRESVYSDLKENLKVVPTIENIFFNVVNYAGFRSVMAHILFFNRCKEITSKKVDCCDKCNRLICSNYEHVKILTKLIDMPVNSLLIYAPYETSLAFKSAFEMEHKCTISLNSFIARTAVNRSIISDEQQFFEDIFPLSANHPLLILLNFLVVSSRITVNFLYCELENKNFCRNDNVKNIVFTLEILLQTVFENSFL